MRPLFSSQSTRRLSSCGGVFPSNPNLLRDEAFHHLQSKHRIISEQWVGGIPRVSRERSTGRYCTYTCDKSTQISFSRPSSTCRLSKQQAVALDYDKLRSTLTNRLQDRTELLPHPANDETPLLPQSHISATIPSSSPAATEAAEQCTVVSYRTTSSKGSLVSKLERLLAVERKVRHR